MMLWKEEVNKLVDTYVSELKVDNFESGIGDERGSIKQLDQRLDQGQAATKRAALRGATS